MKLFLSVPFSSKIDHAGHVDTVYQQTLRRILKVLRNAGHEIFCSLEFEGWQVSSNTDATYALETDFAEISKADRLLVLLEERTSSGVQLEMGYAHAKGKEIEMYQMGKTSWSNKTFGQLDGHTVIAVKNTSDFAERIIAAYTAQE